MAYRVLANHAHVFPPSINQAGTIDRLLQMLDRTGIDEAVCFAPFPHQTDGSGIKGNEWLAGELRKRDRLHGFGTIDFRRSDLKEQVKQARELGLRGLKLHPNAQEFDLLAPEALAVYAAAEANGLFITFHSGVHHFPLKHYNVRNFDEIAWKFPDLRFSLEHVGGYSFFNEALAVIVNNIPFPPRPGRRCMVYAGLTSVFTPKYLRFWYMPRERLEELLLQAGVAQLIFGLDFPYNHEAQTELGLNTIRGLGLSETEESMILGGNLREAIGLPEPKPL